MMIMSRDIESAWAVMILHGDIRECMGAGESAGIDVTVHDCSLECGPQILRRVHERRRKGVVIGVNWK